MDKKKQTRSGELEQPREFGEGRQGGVIQNPTKKGAGKMVLGKMDHRVPWVDLRGIEEEAGGRRRKVTCLANK